jgi:hypothetical protein
MKKTLFTLLFTGLATFVTAQNHDNIISFDGIGKLQLGMGKAELEKLLRMKIVLKHIHVDEVYTETIPAKYLGTDVELHLMRSEDKVALLEAVTVKDPVFKTADGIGTGTDQSMIIDKYEDQLLIIHPEYSVEGVRTNKTIINLASIDNIHAAILFTVVNKKVVAIKVCPTPEFRDRE